MTRKLTFLRILSSFLGLFVLAGMAALFVSVGYHLESMWPLPERLTWLLFGGATFLYLITQLSCFELASAMKKAGTPVPRGIINAAILALVLIGAAVIGVFVVMFALALSNVGKGG